MNINKYVSIAKVNVSTANKEIEELCKIGCLIRNEKGFSLVKNLQKCSDNGIDDVRNNKEQDSTPKIHKEKRRR